MIGCALTSYVPFDGTINICVDELFKSEMTVSGRNKKRNVENAFINFKIIYYFV